MRKRTGISIPRLLQWRHVSELEEVVVNSRKVVFIFWSTLFISSVCGGIVGVFLNWDVYVGNGMTNFIVGVIWMIGLGAAISVVAQMGFFAYLFLHRFGLGLSKTHTLWNRIQWILIVFVYFDLVYFRYVAYAKEGESFFGYMIVPTLLFVYGVLIAWVKARETNQVAFVPALFFMFVITTIEWIPALVANDAKWLAIYITPLLVANTWQLLLLHRLIKKRA